MRIRREHSALYDPDFNFASLRAKERRYLQAVVSYEYARESPIIRKGLKLWLDPKERLEVLWEATGQKNIIVWQTVQKSEKSTRGRILNVCQRPDGGALVQTLASDDTGRMGAVSERRCRPPEERAFLRARLRDILDNGGEGSIHLCDMAREVLADLPWTMVAVPVQEKALRGARRTAWAVRADHLRTIIADGGVQLAMESDLQRGITKQWQTRPPIAADGREVLALRISWKGYDDPTLVKRFAAMLKKARPKQFKSSNRREGHKAATQWKYLDDLAIMRALSVMPWHEVNAVRNQAGLWKCQRPKNESVRRDLLKARRRAHSWFRQLFHFEANGEPIHGRHFKAAAKRRD